MGENNTTRQKGRVAPSAYSTPAPVPTPPTSSLPPLGRLFAAPTEQVSSALANLRSLYFPPPPPPLPKNITIPKRILPSHLTRGPSSVPDSGYASADDGEDDCYDGEAVNRTPSMEAWEQPATNHDAEVALELLKADPFERAFAIKWVTGFIARCGLWIEPAEDGEDEDEGVEGGYDGEAAKRAELMEEATAILSFFSTDEEEEEFAVTRTFDFPLPQKDDRGMEKATVIKVELNDAPLSNQDHTSVGLQSWASSIILAERMTASPSTFSLSPSHFTSDDEKPLRILELGAGTGLLSIVTAKILAEAEPKPTIVATDYHPDVLENLKKNVRTNFPCSSLSGSPPIEVRCLDWENPRYDAPLDEPFDIILAADVVYHPDHARWIKNCVEKLLQVPVACDSHLADHKNGESAKGGVFWLMIAIRSTGRHEGVHATVDTLFPNVMGDAGGHERELVILEQQEVGKQDGLGRADEGGYKLFKIGWGSCP